MSEVRQRKKKDGEKEAEKSGDAAGAKKAEAPADAGRKAAATPAPPGQSQPSFASLLKRGCLALVVFAVVWTAAVYSLLGNQPGYKIVGPIDVIEWNSSYMFTHNCSGDRAPRVLRNTVVAGWKATKLWSPEYLSAKIQNMEGVRTNRWKGQQTLQVYNTDSSAVHSGFKSPKPFKLLKNMPFKQFYEKHAQKPRAYMWYTPLHMTPLARDVRPKYVVMDREKWFSQMLFVGSNVTFGPREEMHHIFVTQHYGRARVRVSHPVNWDKLYLRHSGHPQTGASALPSLEVRDDARFPNFKGVRFFEAVLQPGDVLYVPPYWFMEYHTLGMAMSVFSKSEPEEYETWEKLRDAYLPFKAHWNLAYTILTTRAYVRMLADRVFGYAGKEYLQRVWESRWAGVESEIPKKELAMQLADNPDESGACASVFQSEDATTLAFRLRRGRQLRQQFENSLDDYVKIYKGLESSRREIIFAEHLDEIAEFAVQNSRVHLYLRECLLVDYPPLDDVTIYDYLLE